MFTIFSLVVDVSSMFMQACLCGLCFLDKLAGFVSPAKVLLVAAVATDLRLSKYQQLPTDVANRMLHICVSPDSKLLLYIFHILQQSAECVQNVISRRCAFSVHTILLVAWSSVHNFVRTVHTGPLRLMQLPRHNYETPGCAYRCAFRRSKAL